MSYDVVILSDNSNYPNAMRAIGGYKIASLLRGMGYSVFVLDFISSFYERGILLSTIDKLIGSNTLFVGFSSTLYGLKSENTDPYEVGQLACWPLPDNDMKIIIDHIRKKGIKTVYGGPSHRRSYAPYLDRLKVDYAMFGYGEGMIPDLMKRLELAKNNIDLGHQGIIVLDYDRKAESFDFRHHKVLYTEDDCFQPTDVLPIEMSRGCIFKCRFCNYDMIGKDPRDDSYIRVKESIIEELQNNYDMFGITNYQIVDDTFNDNTSKLKLIRDAILELPFKPSFWCYIRLDLLGRYPEQIGILKDIGVNRMFFGIETLDWISGKLVNKGARPEKILQYAEQVKEVYGEVLVHRHANIIIGLPNDSIENVEKWVGSITDTNQYFDSTHFNVLILGEGSELAADAERYGYTVIEGTGKWRNKSWTSDEAHNYVKTLRKRNIDMEASFVASHHANILMTLGYTLDDIMSKSSKFIESDEVLQRSNNYIEDYIFDVLDILR